MNEELRKIANQAQWAEEGFPLGSLLRQTCDYMAKLEERLEKLEDRHRPAEPVETPARGPRTLVIDGKEINE